MGVNENLIREGSELLTMNQGKPDTSELLKSFANISADDIDKLLHILRKSPEIPVDRDETMNSYLALVKQVFGGNDYLSVGDTPETRQQRYEIYDEMDSSTAYISSALDILSDDATQPDEKGVVLRILSESSKVRTIVEDLFTELEVEEKLSKWARAIAKYGDFFVKVEVEKDKGVVSVIDTVYPGTIERKDLNGKLLAFTDTYQSSADDRIHAPWDFIHFKHKGDIYRAESANNRFSNLNRNSDFYTLTSSYGQSILRPAIKVYAQLRFVENLIILSRLTNSIKRNIFLINTGDTDPKSAFETIKNYADLLKKDISLDIEKGVYNSQKHTISYDEDIFIPVSDTKNDVRIETVGGDVNIAEQYDLEYLLNKLFSSLKIPKAYLNYEQDLNARSTLIQLDIRYARSVSQLQTTLVGGLLRLAKIHLAYRGLNPDDIDLDIQLTSVSSIDKETRLEQKRIAMETARTMWDMVTTMNTTLAESSSETDEDDSEGIGMESQKPGVLDLNYVAEHILTNYFELDREDIDRVMKRKPAQKDESVNTRIFDRRKYPNSDIHEMYPNQQNYKNFESIRENLTMNSVSQKDS